MFKMNKYVVMSNSRLLFVPFEGSASPANILVFPIRLLDAGVPSCESFRRTVVVRSNVLGQSRWLVKKRQVVTF